ncbi:MAG: hypothetical protein GY774_39345 [Planctomycetes bacterium]|nr:hypothetical protein [Planctomycetota bacterium]
MPNHACSVSSVAAPPRVSDPGGQHTQEDQQSPVPRRSVPGPNGATKTRVVREAGQATVSDGVGPVGSAEGPTGDVRHVVVVNKNIAQYSMSSVDLSPNNSMSSVDLSHKKSNDLSEVYLKAYDANA